tara:strand:+ start:122 stop:793 length:672 start_codon:yes stop_codon:yes gene_type:complete
MQIQTSKKIVLYLFVLLLLGTPTNKNFFEINLNKFNKFEILSSSKFNDRDIINDLSNYKYQSLFLLKDEKIIEIIKKYKIIEDYEFYKHYPSKLVVSLKKTKFLAITKIDGVNFYVGSNGNLIKTKDKLEELPIIFGNVNVLEFLKLKNLIDKSNFNFNDIKNLYFFKSKRWDIETKEGLLLKLPRKNLAESFQLFIKIINNQHLDEINIIDLRQNDLLILNG